MAELDFTEDELKALSQLIGFYLTLKRVPGTSDTLMSDYAQPDNDERRLLKVSLSKVDKILGRKEID